MLLYKHFGYDNCGQHFSFGNSAGIFTWRTPTCLFQLYCRSFSLIFFSPRPFLFKWSALLNSISLVLLIFMSFMHDLWLSILPLISKHMQSTAGHQMPELNTFASLGSKWGISWKFPNTLHWSRIVLSLRLSVTRKPCLWMPWCMSKNAMKRNVWELSNALSTGAFALGQIYTKKIKIYCCTALVVHQFMRKNGGLGNFFPSSGTPFFWKIFEWWGYQHLV